MNIHTKNSIIHIINTIDQIALVLCAPTIV